MKREAGTQRLERFGDRLFELCDRAGMTQSALADGALMGRSHVSRLIAHKRRLTVEAATKLAAALQVTPHTLVGGTDAAELLTSDGTFIAADAALTTAIAELEAARRKLAEVQVAHARDRAALGQAQAKLEALRGAIERLAKLAPELRALASIAEHL